MAKKTTKKKTSKKKTARSGGGRSGGASGQRGGGGRAAGSGSGSGGASADGKHLVIVESPTKAKTINRYLGNDYVVMASVGHVRDLPSRAPKGQKQEVPGVDLENDFEPTYQVMEGKNKTVTDLKRAAKKADDVWFATDLDREGEAIAWHLAEALGIDVGNAKRVVFNAITKGEIERAFQNPHSIDEAKVNAQQARRILDRIVGYQVSPLLWKKVAGGLSAGRVQSVATRLVVEREREIEAFIPDEEWRITGYFALSEDDARKLAPQWREFLAAGDGKQRDGDGENGQGPPTVRQQNAWLSERKVLRAELVEIHGEKFDKAIRVDKLIGPLEELTADAIKDRVDRAANAFADASAHDLTPDVARVAEACGLRDIDVDVTEQPQGRGPARWRRSITGTADPATPYAVDSIQTKRTTSKPGAPFITSTMQQAAANRLGFQLQRTMRLAQQLYEGVDLGPSQGQTGLITYMRTDSTHISGDALEMARTYIDKQFGGDYLPAKPNFYSSSNADAQEAHEAIRPTDVSLTPQAVRHALNDEQFKLYDLIWRRFVASQMTPAQWDSTTVLIVAQLDHAATFRASGRTLVFDGFYKVMGVPTSDELVLPPLEEKQRVAPMALEPGQSFTNPPPRYTEASLQKKLEEEGIGRPSTYAAIIQTIQDRQYVQQVAPRDRRLMATDLGRVVTDMLVEAFPDVMDVAYTREMEAELDHIEDERHDWRKMLRDFYQPFKKRLDEAHETLQHAKAVTEEAPYECPKCGAPTVYRFGKNGRFLSCSTYVKKGEGCDYAAPIDREGKPLPEQTTDIVCPECQDAVMTKRTGRFGPFLGCEKYPECKGIVKLDKKGAVVLPKAAPLTTDIACPKCESALYMRDSKRGFWLSCSKFPKCRGRVGWSTLDEAKQKELEAAWHEHLKANPTPVVYTTAGDPVPEGYVPHVTGEETPVEITADDDTPAASSDAA